MNVVIVVGIVAALLFLGAFLSKRRFGLLGLALTAGATLSALWSTDAGYLVSLTGFVPAGPLTQAVAQSVVVLLPAVLLLFHGYTYKGKLGRITGSLLFMALAVAFLIEPIGFALPLSGIGADVYQWIVTNKGIIVSIGVIIAVIDVFLSKPAPKHKRSEKHH